MRPRKIRNYYGKSEDDRRRNNASYAMTLERQRREMFIAREHGLKILSPFTGVTNISLLTEL